jgi:diguanylate cyclase (GGDEF)-like protein/PAS domain S-box-containing protein
MTESIREQLLKTDARESMLRLVADSVPALIAYYELGSLECLFANKRYAEYNGWTPQSILGKTVREAIGAAAYEAIEPHVQAALAGQGSKYTREQTLPDGSKRVIEVNLVPHFDNQQLLCGSFVLINDITGHWRIEQDLRHAEERMRKFVEATNEGLLFHKDRRITDVNAALLRMGGYESAELIGRHTFEFIPAVWHPMLIDIAIKNIDAPYEVELIHKDGRLIPVECLSRAMPFSGETLRIIAIRDISARKQAQAHIEFLALHDPLTLLPNRAYLKERLESLLALARRRNVAMAALFIDLDNFKTVNDSLGHHVGDELLREVAKRVLVTVRDSDIVSRLGGDEFVVVLAEIGSSEDAALVAQKLIEAISAVMVVEGHKLFVSTSIGISLFTQDGETADELIRHADSAMYHAKESGRGNFKFFRPALHHRAAGTLDLERQLRDALLKNQFVLHYQPQKRHSDGAVVGMEALVRWQHPERGLIGPHEFVPFSEMRGLVGAIDRWVLRAACRQMKAWHDAGSLKVPVAVNLSAMDFKQGDLYDEISGVLLETGLSPAFLEIELTESVLMDQDVQVLETLAALSKLGVGLTLDDFGTGYSSLAYLKRYPIGKLKIDRSFIKDLTTDEDDRTLTTAIIQMARGLRLKTVAEGVETQAQLDLLAALGCEEFQGYLISAPLRAQDVSAFIAT